MENNQQLEPDDIEFVVVKINSSPSANDSLVNINVSSPNLSNEYVQHNFHYLEDPNDFYNPNDPDVLIEEPNDAEVEGLNETGELSRRGGRTRRKGKDVDKNNWKKIKMKKLREKGKQYTGVKKQNGKYGYCVDRPGRTLKERCTCKLSNKDETGLRCNFISDEDRIKIHEELWEMEWPERRAYICSVVEKDFTSRKRHRKNAEETRRSFSFKYFIKLGDERLRVCRTMFVNTYCVNEWSVRSWKLKQTESSPPNIPFKLEVDANDSECRERATNFLKNLPTLPPHFCQTQSTKLYLEPLWDSKTEVYKTYISQLPTDEVPVLRCVFDDLFENANLDIFRPKKDFCNECLRHDKGLISDEVFNIHIADKNRAREEKQRDTEGSHRVFTLDHQAVLLAPKNNASEMFHNSKLNVYNYTLLDLKSRQGYCFLWHECSGGLTADVFATLLFHFLDKYVQPKRGETIIFYSENCPDPNKNCTLSNALLNFAVQKNCVIIQKYFPVGDVQIEPDNIYSCIYAKVKNVEINVPSDYIRPIKETKKKLTYVVEYLGFQFFKNWNDVRYLESIQPSGTSTVDDIKTLKYTPAKRVYYKLSFDSNYEILQTTIPNIPPIRFENLPQLYATELTISKSKYEHLQILKSTLLSDHHAFYNNLKYHENETDAADA